MKDESTAALEQFRNCLNSFDYVPDKGFSRNSGIYPLICYINNITGALLSANYEIVAAFVARASEHMRDFPPTESNRPYYLLATSYLTQVVHHLNTCGAFVEFDASRVPASILGGGPQQAPKNSFKPKPLRGSA
ncbi:hypothetical protein [Lysobacter sp. Root604]|uniref:hypothetical protein n=1 Tax=Lysobacter sp. Root604 TaxID=1736568 RepID=UPI0006FFBEB6|nr:hypothetical protein [Lysobacter sp. Root604]KRA20812.1 hypothetical protein ASD69_05770 [Lysobacter sp. Root604]